MENFEMAMFAINIEAFGMIPHWIDRYQEDPLWFQVHEGYAHGGGWRDFEGFEVLQGDAETPYEIQYPEDPVYEEIGRIQTEQEVLVMFPNSWVLWQNLKDGNTKIARID